VGQLVRWKAQGNYRGGFPGAPTEAIGRHVSFTGTDILRIADGKRPRVLGQHRQPAVLPAARCPRGARRLTAQRAICERLTDI
jgi:hypothetical protein